MISQKPKTKEEIKYTNNNFDIDFNSKSEASKGKMQKPMITTATSADTVEIMEHIQPKTYLNGPTGLKKTMTEGKGECNLIKTIFSLI